MLAREERERISLDTVSRLKPEYRTALYLFAYEQMNYRSIAKVMGKTQAQIKITLHRARKIFEKTAFEEGIGMKDDRRYLDEMWKIAERLQMEEQQKQDGA